MLIDVNVDQFTLTIYIDEDEYLAYDEHYFDYIQDRFASTLNLIDLFGLPVRLSYGDGWYNTIYDYGYHDRHLFFKYNDESLDNQISVVFHANMLKEYLKSYRNKIDDSMTVFKLLKKMSTLGTVRLSRLDIAIDLIDENIVVDDLAKRINNYDVLIKNSRGSNIAVESIQQIGNGGKVETMYINKRKSASFLRIYDKKIEALLKESADVKTAIECESWTRIELELKKYYANNITASILKCESEFDFKKVILGAFLEKFKFLELEKPEEDDSDGYVDMQFYQDLKDLIKNEIVHLPGHERERVTDLERKYKNLFNNGSMRLFAMIKQAYGEEGLKEVFERINKDCEKVELNRDHARLINKFKSEVPFFKDKRH